MNIISFIEDDALIKKIWVYLGLGDMRNHDPRQLNGMHLPAIETELTYDYASLQLLFPPV
jgi:hypothetical protein